MPTLYDHGDPTDAEQYLLELVNRARADPAAEAARFNIDLNEGLDPGTLSPSPKPPLALTRFLLKAAREHGQWMIDTDMFGHAGKNGSSPGERMQQAGYQGGTAESEALALVYSTGDVKTAVPEAHENLFVDKDQPGRGHRKIILLERDEIGTGVRFGEYQGEMVAMVVEDLITLISPTYAAFVVGVVHSTWPKYEYAPGGGWKGFKVTLSKGDYYAVTSASGGYAIPIHNLSGPLTVTFEKGFWKSVQTVNVTKGDSIKVDYGVPWWGLLYLYVVYWPFYFINVWKWK